MIYINSHATRTLDNMPMPDSITHQPLLTLIQALQESADFTHAVTQFEIVETHISYILLTGSYAYKFQKPVDMGFLDFSTLEKRKYYCEEALRLNRHHAADLYLDVVTITGDELAPGIDGEGPVLEYAVKMAQFDRSQELDKLIIKQGLPASLIDELAAVIAAFHDEAEVAETDTAYGTPTQVWQIVTENFSRIWDRLPDDEDYHQRLQTIEQWSEAEFKRHEAAFKTRKAEGFIRECHGDLHLGNIVLQDDHPVLFDCIEFSASLRWIDVLNELAFLVMDLDEHDCPALSQRLLNGYLEHTGDYSGLKVLPYYLVYRAMVRAMVACIRLDQTRDDQAIDNAEACTEYRRYIDLAYAYTRQTSPVLFFTYGVSGSGKTSISQSILEQWGAIRLRTDVERKRLHGLAAHNKSGSPVKGGLYSEEITRRTYKRVGSLAIDLLNAGYAVIVDASFLQAAYRRDFIELAYACEVPIVILHSHASEATLRHRIEARQAEEKDASEADLKVLTYQLEMMEPLSEQEQQYCVDIDTDQALDFNTILTTIKAILESSKNN